MTPNPEGWEQPQAASAANSGSTPRMPPLVGSIPRKAPPNSAPIYSPASPATSSPAFHPTIQYQQYVSPREESLGLGLPPVFHQGSEQSSVSSVSTLTVDDQGRIYTAREIEGDAISGQDNTRVGQHDGGVEAPPQLVHEEWDQHAMKTFGSPEVRELNTPYTLYPAYSPPLVTGHEQLMQKLDAAPDDANSMPGGSYWKPVTAKPVFLGFFISYTIAMVVVIDILLRVSEKNAGLADAAALRKDDSWGFTFLHAYLPLIAAIIYSQTWWAINIDVQRTEPYARLSRPTGAKGSASLFLEFTLLTAPTKALIQREWIVFCSVVGYIIALLAIPPLQGTLFSIYFTTYTEDLAFSTSQYFDEQNTLALNWPDYEGIFRVQTMLSFGRGVRTSAWITQDGFVALPGSVPGHMVEGRRNETWEFETQVFKMDLECVEYQPNRVYGSRCDVTVKNNTCEWPETVFVAEYAAVVDERDYKFYVSYANLREKPVLDASEDTIDWYWGDYGVIYQNDTSILKDYGSAIVSQHRNLTAPFQGIPRRMILTWNKVKLGNDDKGVLGAVEQPVYELHICKPKYSAAIIPVAFITDAANSYTISATLDNRLHINETLFYERAVDFSAKFDKDEFEWNVFGGLPYTEWKYSVANRGTSSVITGEMKPLDLPYTAAWGGLNLMVNSRNHQMLLKPGGLIKEAKRFAGYVFANFVDVVKHSKEDFGESNDSVVKVQGKRTWIRRRLFVLKGFARAVQGCFIACTVLACGILSLSLRRKIHLHQDPDSIAAKLAIIKQNTLPAFRYHGRSSSKVLRENIGDTKFRLGKNGQLQQIEDPASAPDEWLTPSQADIQENFHASSRNSWLPFMLRLRYAFSFILYVLGICAGVITLWKISQRSGAIGPVGSGFIGGAHWISVDFLWTTFPIFIIQVVKLQWGFLDEALRAFEPFARLLARMAPAKGSVEANYSSKVVGWVTVKAVRCGAFLLAFITLISLLTEFLTVATGALFERELRPVLTTLPLTRPWKINTTPIPGSELYFDTLSRQTDNNFMLNSIFSAAYNVSGQTPWTTSEWSFAPINVNTQSGGNLTVTTAGVRAQLDCENLPIPSGLVKELNFTVNTNIGYFDGHVDKIPKYNWTRSSLEKVFGQDTAWVITSGGRGIFENNNRILYHKGNDTYSVLPHPNPWMAMNHSQPFTLNYEQQWETNYKVDNYQWGYWEFFFRNGSSEPSPPRTMTIMDLYAELPGTFLVFWAQGEVMGYRLDGVTRMSANLVMGYSHLYRHKPNVTLLACHPRYESATAEVTLDISSQRILDHKLLTTPSPVENATAFIYPPPGTNITDPDPTGCAGACKLRNHRFGFGAYFLPPLFNRNDITGIQQGTMQQMFNTYEQRQSFNVSASPAAYLAALPYVRKGEGKKLSDPAELGNATSRAFSTVFLEFAAAKSQVNMTTPGKLTVAANWNLRNFVFVQDNSTALPSTLNGGVLKGIGMHAVLSERVVLVPAAAVLVLLIMVAMVLGVIAAVWARRALAGRLPRAPFTVGSVLGWVYASRATSVVGEGGGGREKISWEGRSFGMGVYMGIDGEVHWGVDEEPLVEGDELLDQGSGSVCSRPGSG